MSMTVRDARVDDALPIARVHIESWRTTYAGIVLEPYLASLDLGERSAWWQRQLRDPMPRSAVYVAEDEGGHVAGFASCGAERAGDPECDGELYAIYLLQADQGRGTGRALFAAVTAALVRHGFSGMLLWVLEANVGARRFYTGLGGAERASQTITIGGRSLVEVAYGWTDLAALDRDLIQQ